MRGIQELRKMDSVIGLWSAVIQGAIIDIRDLRGACTKRHVLHSERIGAIKFVFNDDYRTRAGMTSRDLRDLIAKAENVREIVFEEMKDCSRFIKMLKSYAPKWYLARGGRNGR